MEVIKMSNNTKYVRDAFKSLELVEDKEFDLFGKDSFEELGDFIDDEEDVAVEQEVIDLDAEEPEELKDSYVGDVILGCPVCHTNLFKAVDDVVIDEETDLCCVGEACPVCGQEDGFKVIGKVAPFEEVEEEEETEVEVETEPDEAEVEVKEKVRESFKKKREAKKLQEQKLGRVRKILKESKQLNEDDWGTNSWGGGQGGVIDTTSSARRTKPSYNGKSMYWDGVYKHDIDAATKAYTEYWKSKIKKWIVVKDKNKQGRPCYRYKFVVDIDGQPCILTNDAVTPSDRLWGPAKYIPLEKFKDKGITIVADNIRTFNDAFDKAEELAKKDNVPMYSWWGEAKFWPTDKKEEAFCPNCGKEVCECDEKKVDEAIITEAKAPSVKEIAKFLEDSIKAIEEDPSVTARYVLDDDLCLYVGYEGGFDKDETGNDERICAKIAERNDYYWVDFEAMNMPWDPETGDVWDTDSEVSPSDAKYYVDEYKNIRKALDKGDVVLESKKSNTRGKKLTESKHDLQKLPEDIQDIVGEHFDYTMDFDFLDIVADILLRIDDFEDVNIWDEIDSALIYTDDQWRVLWHYVDSPEDLDSESWSNALETFGADLESLCGEIAEARQGEEEEVEESINEDKLIEGAEVTGEATKQQIEKIIDDAVANHGKTSGVTFEPAITFKSDNGPVTVAVAAIPNDMTMVKIACKQQRENRQFSFKTPSDAKFHAEELAKVVNKLIKGVKLPKGWSVPLSQAAESMKPFDGEKLKESFLTRKLDEDWTWDGQVPEIAEKVEEQIGDRTSVTWDEFEMFLDTAIMEVLGLSQDELIDIVGSNDQTLTVDGKPKDYYELDTDVRIILSMNGWDTVWEGDNEGGLEQIVECKQVNEAIENATIETEDQVINLSAETKDEDMNADWFDRESMGEGELLPDGGEEMIAPLDDADIQEIEDAQQPEEEPVEETEVEAETEVEPGEEEVPAEEAEFPEEEEEEVEEVQEESFKRIAETYLKKVYSNVKSFEINNKTFNEGLLTIDGTIEFNSGKKKTTTFVFEAVNNNKTIAKSKKEFVGLNETFTDKKDAFVLNTSINDKKLVAESLSYDYPAKTKGLTEGVKTVKGIVK